MSYTVSLGGSVIYTPQLAAVDRRFALLSAVLTEEENKIPKFDFLLPPGHVAITSADLTAGTIEVTDDAELLFIGRVRQSNQEFFNRITVTCEGALGYLCDIPDRYVTADEENTVTVQAAFAALMAGYAAAADAGRKIYAGTCDVSGVITSTQTGQCWDTLNGWIREFGGYLTLRRSDGKLYLDYKAARSGLDSSQVIRFGVNLLSTLDRMTDLTKIETGVLAIGGVPEGEDDPVTLDGYPGTTNGVLFAASASVYGSIYKRVEFKDALTQSALYAAASAYLSNVNAATVSLKLAALENKLLGLAPQHMKISASYTAISEPHGLNAAFPLLKRKLDLLMPQNSTTEFGAAETALSERQATWYKSSKTAEMALQTASAAMSRASSAATPSYVDTAIANSEARQGDYVTETGTSGIWTWRKWASGAAECIGLSTLKVNSSGMNSVGSIYYAAGSESYPPGFFVDVPSITASAHAGVNKFWVGQNQLTQNASAAKYTVFSIDRTVTQTFYTSIKATGRWK